MSTPEPPSINELAAALAKAQGEIAPALKDAVNPDFKSRYASLPVIREAVREAFARHGLAVVQRPSVIDGKLVLTTWLLHASGQAIDCGELSAQVDLANPQQMGSAITYFRRYALAALSQTVADEDDDGNAASRRARTRQEPAPPAAEDAKRIEHAKTEIAATTTLEQLRAIGEVLKTETPPVQSAVRAIYRDRYNALRQKETNADPDHRSQEAATSSH